MREKIIIFALLPFIFWNISDTFGGDRCIDDGDVDNKDYTDERMPSHTCKKVDLNFCYFPNPTYIHLAPLSFSSPKVTENELLNDGITFSSRYGGCSLSFSQNTKTLRAGLISPSIWHSFEKYCGRNSFKFSILASLKYKLYFKDYIPKDKYPSHAESNVGNIRIGVGGYSTRTHINTFKSMVDNGRPFREKGIYTLRIDSKIVDDKCTTQEKKDSELIDKSIEVLTNLLLKLKLNDNDNIVYDDKETKKIEVNADQDEFYFNSRNA